MAARPIGRMFDEKTSGIWHKSSASTIIKIDQTQA
jgi:hypothetical protein